MGFSMASLLMTVAVAVAGGVAVEGAGPRSPLRMVDRGAGATSLSGKVDVPETPVSPEVTIEGLGTAEGTVLTSFLGGPFSAFLSLPYAHQPLRFQYATLWDTSPWTEVPYNAGRLRARCLQSSYLTDKSSGSEDCLHVSVYTPLLDLTDVIKEKSWKGRPVMIFIHGGAYMSGEATLYMPTKLLDKDVVVVVLQYRLGTLGFLYSGTEDAPGNMGLHDQILAIRWVHKYIHHFGGDPGLVTVFGQSAGGASTSLLMTSPEMFPEKNGGYELVQRFFAMSGSALEYWTLEHNPEEDFFTQVEEAGCKEGNADKDAMVKCMRKLSPDEVVASAGRVSSKDTEAGGLGFIGQIPTVQEVVTDGAGAELPRVLAEHPLAAVRGGRFLQTPFMTGSVRDEGSLVMGIVYGSFLVPNTYHNDSNFLEFKMLSALSQCFGINDETNAVANAFQLAFFPEGVDMANWTETAGGAIDLAGMLFLKSGLWSLAHHMKNFNKTLPIFFYSFEYESDNSMFEFMVDNGAKVPMLGGVTHGDDLLYLFNLPGYFNAKDKEIISRVTTLYTNFAKHGDPTPATDDNWSSWSPQWPQFSPQSKMLQVIAENIRPEYDFTSRWNYNKYGYPHQPETEA